MKTSSRHFLGRIVGASAHFDLSSSNQVSFRKEIGLLEKMFIYFLYLIHLMRAN